MKVNEIIKRRKSIRKFKKDEIVSDEKIKILLEAAMLAPSACNLRICEFIVCKNRDKLNEIIVAHPHTSMLKTASCAIIVCANTRKNLKTAILEKIAKDMHPQDCSAATQNILLQAVELGLGTCWCGVEPNKDRKEKIAKIFDLPKNIEPFNVIAVGIPDEPDGSRGFYEENKVTWVN